MLNLQMFKIMYKTPTERKAPVTRADVMEQFPTKLSKTNQRPYSKKALAAVELTLKLAGKIKRTDLMEVMKMGELRMGPMRVVTGIALLRSIGAVTVEKYKVNGKFHGVMYKYIPE